MWSIQVALNIEFRLKLRLCLIQRFLNMAASIICSRKIYQGMFSWQGWQKVNSQPQLDQVLDQKSVWQCVQLVSSVLLCASLELSIYLELILLSPPFTQRKTWLGGMDVLVSCSQLMSIAIPLMWADWRKAVDAKTQGPPFPNTIRKQLIKTC